MSKALALVIAFLSISAAHAGGLTADQRLSDLHQLEATIQSGYGPLHYKADTLSLNVDDLTSTYEKKVAAAKTDGDFYYTLLQYIAEFHDSHFSGSVPTDHVAKLGFTTDLVEGKVLIDTVDRTVLDTTKFPFERGDEVVALDGTPVAQVLDQLEPYRGMGYEPSARRYAAMSVAYRAGTTYPVPTGDATVTIRHGLSDITDTVKLTWVESGTAIDEANHALRTGRSVPAVAPANFDELSIADVYAGMPQTERGFRCAGITRETIPADATVIMMKPVVAYYHPTAKGNIGYFRLPEYAPTTETGADDFDTRFAQYEYIVSVMEKNTVGLVIDQDHNCGGSVDFLQRVVGLFMDKPFPAMQFQFLANKEEYLQFKAYSDQTPVGTLASVEIAKVLGLVHDSWLKGDFMTPKTSFNADELIQPNGIHYTKPVVMTIDEMSGSGGDGFPSLMQGYGRAKLVGTRTMGAGGHVVDQAPLNYSQLKFRMTKSLFFRPDGVAVENNGAHPDYPYTITRDDFTYGYRDYQAFYESKLLDLIQ